MPRTKSEATIQLERDRAIRKERRERKRAEREARKQLRDAKAAVRARIAKNGIPHIRHAAVELGIHDARTYSPLALCSSCHGAFREKDLIGGACEACAYSNISKGGMK